MMSSPAQRVTFWSLNLTGRFDNVVIRRKGERRATGSFQGDTHLSARPPRWLMGLIIQQIHHLVRCGASLSHSRSRCCPTLKHRLIDCLVWGPGLGVPSVWCINSEVAGLGSLVQRPQLLEARPPFSERLLPPPLPCPSHIPATPPIQPRWAERAQWAGRRAPSLGGEDLQGVEGPRIRMLVGVADDLAQVAGEVLAGEGQGASSKLGGASLALGREPGGGDVPAEAGGRGGGGRGCYRRRQGGGAGGLAEGVQRLGAGRDRGRLVEQVMMVVVGRRRVVQGSGAAVLERLGWARLEGLLQLRHVVGILDTNKQDAVITNKRGR